MSTPWSSVQLAGATTRLAGRSGNTHPADDALPPAGWFVVPDTVLPAATQAWSVLVVTTPATLVTG
jgi:hypothetical protein